MIYCSMKPDSLGSDDLYVTFKTSDGSWSEPVHMGNKINTDKSENRPYVSPDGKYFFYASNKRGYRDIYWVDAKIIEELKRELEHPILKGPYLGQNPPGLIPEVFAPGIISTGVSEGCSYFSKDGQLYLFARAGSDAPGIFLMEQKDGVWSRPQLAPFSAGRHDWDFTLAPDGKTVFIASGRPHTKGGAPERDHSIWISEKTKSGWTEAQLLPFPVNAGQHDSYPSVTEDGTLYFFSRRSGGLGEGDIYKAKRINGEYTKVKNLGPPINSEFHEVDSFIAPDESYIIFCSDRPSGYGREDIYISFHQDDESWTEPLNLGDRVNTPYDEYIPAVTPDGKYFFFTTNKTGSRNIYWTDAKILYKLLPKN